MNFQSWLGTRFYGGQHSPWLLFLQFHPKWYSPIFIFLMDALLAPWSGHAQLTSLSSECKKKTFISRISQGTLLKGVYFHKRLLAIILASSKECDQRSSSLSIMCKNFSLLTICHKGFQSHFIASIFLTLAILNSLKHLATKLSHCCFNKSLCLYFASLNCFRHSWYSINSYKELANDSVSPISKRSIVWEIETITSSPYLAYIWSNSENYINIHITNIKNIQKMNKK